MDLEKEKYEFYFLKKDDRKIILIEYVIYEFLFLDVEINIECM